MFSLKMYSVLALHCSAMLVMPGDGVARHTRRRYIVGPTDDVASTAVHCAERRYPAGLTDGATASTATRYMISARAPGGEKGQEGRM